MPAPFLVRPPVPAMTLEITRALPLVSIVPPPAFKVIARLVEIKPSACSVPPLKLRAPPMPPSLLSLEAATVPPLIARPPVKPLSTPSVSVPAPVLVTPPVPPMAEPRVTLLPLVSTVPPAAPIAASREEMSVVLPVAHCRPPPLSVIVPVPRLLEAAKLTRPPVTESAPV
jgi:hypothetical protein